MLVSTPYHIWELRYQGVDIWREIKNWLPCEGLNAIAFRCFKLLVWRNLSNENKHSISLKKKSFIDPKESSYSQKFYFSWRGQKLLRARQRVYAEHRTYAIFLCAYAKIFSSVHVCIRLFPHRLSLFNRDGSCGCLVYMFSLRF